MAVAALFLLALAMLALGFEMLLVMGLPSVLANLNATFDGRPWGNGGVLALSSTSSPNTAPYSDAELASSPVNTQTRDGNSCVPPVMVKQSPIQ